MRIEERIEYDIEPQLHAAITKLREESFPKDHKPRSYYKQLPHFRFLAYEDETLVGHMGVDHRVVSVGESVFSTFGVIDLCVREEYQGRGIGGVPVNTASAAFLAPGAADQKISLAQDGSTLALDLPLKALDEHDSVIKVLLESPFPVQ